MSQARTGEDLNKAKEELPAYRNVSFLKNSTFPSFVIQKYIEKPMLFKGFKFDIRVWACLNHDLELFVFRYSRVIQ